MPITQNVPVKVNNIAAVLVSARVLRYSSKIKSKGYQGFRVTRRARRRKWRKNNGLTKCSGSGDALAGCSPQSMALGMAFMLLLPYL